MDNISSSKKLTCLITGGARGIGAAIKSQLMNEGYQIIAPTRTELDLADYKSVDLFLQSCDYQVDILINNAGENKINNIENIIFEDWLRTQQVNLNSAFLLIQKLAPLMAQRGFGRIVNISSVYSLRSRIGRAAYTSTKAAINALTQSAAVEYSEKNVLVNAISPGFIETDLTYKNNTPEQIQSLLSRVPMGRMAKAEEIANVVSFLISTKNTYMTGQNLIVDGGFSCV